MPLLHKKPFLPTPFPPDLKENEEVFYCGITREIFRDYDEYCERVILCNSLGWSCSLTGRVNMTYQEAAASEHNIKKLLKKFPLELRIPVLYLASLCERKSFGDLAEEVYQFVKARFFIGETVMVSFPGKDGSSAVVSCHVLTVYPPSPEDLQNVQQTSVKNGERREWIPASLYRYEVVRSDSGEEPIVAAERVSRRKSSYTKDKNRLYIKQFVHLEGGLWRLKDSCNQKYGISRVKFDQIFCGVPPIMNAGKVKTLKQLEKEKKMLKYNNMKGKKQETLTKYFKAMNNKSPKPSSPNKRSPTKKNLGTGIDKKGSLGKGGGIVKRKRRSKKEMEAAAKIGGTRMNLSQRARFEAKKLARLEMREKKKNLAEFVKEWSMKREDLECEDLKELPSPCQLETRLPNEYFGSAVMLMEFLFAFRKILPVKDFFPNGVTFDLVERALLDKEVAGPLSDMLQLLLNGIFDLLDQESEEIKETDVKITPGLIFTRGDADVKNVVKSATMCESWLRKHHSLPLNQLTVDPSTVTEVLRLHLLTAGAVPPKSRIAKWRYQARGGYCNNDDPAVMLKLKQPHLVEKLAQYNVCDFEIGEKMAVLSCLMDQVLTYSTTRDLIEEGCEKARIARVEMRSVRAAEVRREKEEALKQKGLKKGEGVVQKEPELGPDALSRELRSGECGPDGKKEEQRLWKEMRRALGAAQLAPLGTDRAHRRFWIFDSVPGLFVEEGSEETGPCLPRGTPTFACDEEDGLAYLRRLFEESGNKENLLEYSYQLNHSNGVGKKHLTEMNGDHELSIDNEESKLSTRSSLSCWGDSLRCPVHGPNRHKSWSVFSEPEEIDSLIESLNRRGHRERRLRQTLLQEKDEILRRLKACPGQKCFNILSAGPTGFTQQRNKSMKQYDVSANLSYPEGTPLDSIMEASLRDLILETEEKISGGALGYLRVKDRMKWRTALMNNSYDKQCKKLIWGTRLYEEEMDVSCDIKEESIDIEDIKKEVDEESRASTPVFDKEEVSAWRGFQETPQRPLVLDLASAILQLAQAVEFKYLKRPLGLDQREKDRGIDSKIPTPAMERWEKALMEATSFPQLFLFLSTLDNSVSWDRSALNASCRVCRRMKDPESMLLCDTCNKGHHLYCLKPKLAKVPQGDWHCPKCRPKEKVQSPVKKKRRLFSEESDDEEEEDYDYECKTCGDMGAELGCSKCETRLHLSCVVPQMRRVPKSKWFCHECRAANYLEQKQAQARRSGATLAVDVKEEQHNDRVVEQPVKETKGRKSEGESNKRRRRGSSDEAKPTRKMNGITNGIKREHAVRNSKDKELAEEERVSRRRCSKAATAKISHFAKQLRHSEWDDDEGGGEEDESGGSEDMPMRGSRRSGDRRRRWGSDRKPRDLPLDNAALQEILDHLMHHAEAPPFLRPVAKSEAPDYHEIIKRPMDFGTIKHKLNMLSYTKNSEVVADAELLFNNCVTYNEQDSHVYRAGEKLREIFYKMCQERSLLDDDSSETTPEPSNKRSRIAL